jgi:hypothetical protein
MPETNEVRIHQVSTLEAKCRDVLQHDSVFKALTRKSGLHGQVCALLDFVGDSEIALLSVSSSNQRREVDPYFLAYGVLQLMYSRQVALKAVLRAFDISIPKLFEKSSLSIARDRVIGHPVTTDGAAHVIVRHTLNENGFEFWSYRGSETERGQKVNYESLLSEHLDAMIQGLDLLYQQLAKVENERREEMRQQPLKSIFQGIPYSTQCMVAAIVEEKYRTLFSINSNTVLSALETFRAGLLKRYGEEWASGRVDHVIEGIRMLQGNFPPQDKRANSQFQIIADGVDLNVKDLMQLASDIDEKEAQNLE